MALAGAEGLWHGLDVDLRCWPAMLQADAGQHRPGAARPAATPTRPSAGKAPVWPN